MSETDYSDMQLNVNILSPDLSKVFTSIYNFLTHTFTVLTALTTNNHYYVIFVVENESIVVS